MTSYTIKSVLMHDSGKEQQGQSFHREYCGIFQQDHSSNADFHKGGSGIAATISEYPPPFKLCFLNDTLIIDT